MSKRVAISGYYGFDNLGDEAVLFSMLGALKDARPVLQPVVLSHNPQRTAELYGVEAVNRWRFKAVVGALRRADMLISGGGSLLQDVTGLKSLIYYLGIIRLAKLLRKPVVFYAQGIGPVNSGLGRRLMKLVVNKVDLITVRDEKSAQDLVDMGVTRPPVRVTADPVLGLAPESVPNAPGREILAGYGIDPSEQRLLGVSVREWQGLSGYKQALAAVLDELAGRGWRVVFLPMHHPDDAAPSREVARLMRNDSIVLEERYTVQEVASVVRRFNLLIGMRLHALILAAVMGVPPLGISYDPKIDRFLEQLGLQAAGKVEELDDATLLAHVEPVLADLPGYRDMVKGAMGDLRQRARESAVMAVGVLDRCPCC